MKNNRLGKPFSEVYNELCKEDPTLDEEVKTGLEELRIREKLYFAREKANLTQREVADRMHVNRSFVSKLENHPQNMKLSTLNKYSKAVGRTLKLELA